MFYRQKSALTLDNMPQFYPGLLCHRRTWDFVSSSLQNYLQPGGGSVGQEFRSSGFLCQLYSISRENGDATVSGVLSHVRIKQLTLGFTFPSFPELFLLALC